MLVVESEDLFREGFDFMIGSNENASAVVKKLIAGINSSAFLLGDCRSVLNDFPLESIDCVITSPPYWKQRSYDISDDFAGVLIGNEDSPDAYVAALSDVFSKIYRVLKPGGSVWLNLGDKYCDKNLMGMPWRVALALQKEGWILRNDIIWEKMKGTQSTDDRLRNVHEHIFHFVKRKDYYYDADGIRISPRLQPTVNGNEVISATGVSGKKYREQIARSELLGESEKAAALQALEGVLQEIRDGKVVDFRMTIRGNQRTLHSDSQGVSGRAKELADKGFFVLKSYAKGYLPSDVWRIAPEDIVRSLTDTHYAVFPVELLQVPLKATCPANGVVLDPFMGTGSTILAAVELGNRGIGIDISETYIEVATERLAAVQSKLIM